ncbi:ABC transporter ATP-binding protein [Thauera sinica]|uniref:ABC transporter ATP-binding protein n=1 Tax=Thauera sinica TaxID=2665146 RepID=A0ABW1ANN7_9RHOO|nr:ABC transporter ATP-binding protein [Thauera sp. K11]ATE62766.1 ABC transporter [Thauera sp. K11]
MTQHASSGTVSIRNAGKTYVSRGRQVVALDDCSIDIQAGEFCAIVGPSGCGKSTLLNAIAGFDSLSAGEIVLDERVINAPGLRLRPGPDRIVVFQHDALFPWATVRENLIRAPMLQGRLSEAEALARARELLARVGLADVEGLYPGAMSSGMCRRVEMVRALLNAPRILLLDEPFRGMDALTKSATHDALLELHASTGGTVLFITHDLEEAIYLADRVLVMTSRPGRIKRAIEVDLPRPRHRRMLTSGRFLALHHIAVEAVREEAVRAFVSGERELA